jgi:hypothetical protein
VTARKPKSATPSADENLWFEGRAIADMEKLPTSAWQDMIPLWQCLPLARSATRRRVLTRCLELASERGDAFSAKLVERFAKAAISELSVSESPKAVVQDRGKFQAAAQYVARNPHASLSVVAKAVGGKKTTVRQWLTRPDFRNFLEDEKKLINPMSIRVSWEAVARGFKRG